MYHIFTIHSSTDLSATHLIERWRICKELKNKQTKQNKKQQKTLPKDYEALSVSMRFTDLELLSGLSQEIKTELVG